MRSDLWQGYCGHWQNQFIQENLIPLGHFAWQGVITQGRGMVVCDVAIKAESANWSSDLVEYAARFVPLSGVSTYLQTLSLEATLIERLIDIVQTYDPVQTILLVMNENGRTDITLLQHLAISTTDCHRQMQQRWSEFQLESPK